MQYIPFFNSTAFANEEAVHEVKSSHKNARIILILGVVGGLALVFMACAFAIGKRLKSAAYGKGYEDQENTPTDPDDKKLGEEGFGVVYNKAQTNVAG